MPEGYFPYKKLVETYFIAASPLTQNRHVAFELRQTQRTHLLFVVNLGRRQRGIVFCRHRDKVRLTGNPTMVRRREKSVLGSPSIPRMTCLAEE
jgi:hypothetical protein